MRIIVCILFAFQFSICAAQDSLLEERLQRLERRIITLEYRVNSIEKTQAKTAQKQSEDSVLEMWKNKALERRKKDYKDFPDKVVNEVEELYGKASQEIQSARSKKIFRDIIKNHPKFNRAGCSALYLAQESEGKEREQLLIEAAEKFSDCFYLDGVQVGAYSRYLLALMYRDREEVEKAKELMRYIREHYPGAVNHKGQKLEMDLHDY